MAFPVVVECSISPENPLSVVVEIGWAWTAEPLESGCKQNYREIIMKLKVATSGNHCVDEVGM